MQLRAWTVAVCGVMALCVGSTWAGEIKGKTRDLFNGKDLTGWKVMTCEVEVQDGAILLKSGNGLVQAEGQFGDFILELDWKALNKEPQMWDSGIYFRYTSIPPKRPWPSQYQVNLRKGDEGNVGGLPGAKSTGLTKPGQWNHFKFTVQGATAALEINGKPAWKADGLKTPKGFLSLQSEVPQGGQFLFRNIRITTPD
jgi:hypothetical protein